MTFYIKLVIFEMVYLPVELWGGGGGGTFLRNNNDNNAEMQRTFIDQD